MSQSQVCLGSVVPLAMFKKRVSARTEIKFQEANVTSEAHSTDKTEKATFKSSEIKNTNKI